jgi:L-aspartate oxidase
MTTTYDNRRYLTNFDAGRTPNLLTDVLVIGSGVAGLKAAIDAAQHTSVTLITKADLADSNTAYAQGGIAAVMPPRTGHDAHVADTLRLAEGLGDPQAIEIIVRQGPQHVQHLIDWGARFDQADGNLLYTREAGHSENRILHAQGDATGREISRALLKKAHDVPHLRIFTHCFVIDLLTVDQQCVGAVTFHPKYGHQLIWARQTILATGGCGRLYRETTNPPVATGDGHAIGFRAGAKLQDMEMIQFHPTTLYVAGATRALITEAVRGEGGHLVDKAGRRFMLDVHPDAELAPRDVVSRAIIKHMLAADATCVYLDVRHIPGEKFTARFPGITKLCADFDLDITRDLIPVRPSAHYMIGGLATDLAARTNVPGLLACGEAASTGVHGANRLASNSLLEGLVFGAIAAKTALENLSSGLALTPRPITSNIPQSHRTELDLNDIRNSLRSLMWRNVGIERTGSRLDETSEIIHFWSQYVLDKVFDDTAGWETQNMLTVARLMVQAAQQRTESRGVHYRADHPDPDPALAYHIQQQRSLIV